MQGFEAFRAGWNLIHLPLVFIGKENAMKKILSLLLLVILLTLNGCAPLTTATSAPPTATEPIISLETQTPIAVSPTEAEQSADWKLYLNSTFGLSFQYPSSWFGPDEYLSDQDLRVEVGSDKVYPYGTSREEQVYEIKNSYYVLIQYSKNNQNQYWRDIYQSLLNLKDGESLSNARSLVIRVRSLNFGRFEGIEYISTLSETAQTEPVYSRQVILVDEHSNLLTVMGSPNNVEISSGAGWREAYQRVDQANVALFHQIVESIAIK